jgi:hypothetical protein
LTRRFASQQFGFIIQAWAQSVRTGGTIIVLHSGNHEFVGIRHRESQTLYLSPLIVPSRCAYGKIHVGIYIAAIKDALDRVRQDIKADEEKKAKAAAAEKHGPDKGPDLGEDEDEEDEDTEGRNRKRRKPDVAKGSKQRQGRPSAPRGGSGRRGKANAGKTRSTHQVFFSHFTVFTTRLTGIGFVCRLLAMQQLLGMLPSFISVTGYMPLLGRRRLFARHPPSIPQHTRRLLPHPLHKKRICSATRLT